MPSRFSDYDPNVRNPAIENLLKDIGRKIKSAMPPNYGFMLAIFQFTGKEFFYLSSAERDTMIQALQEFLDDQKQREAAGL